MNIAVVDKETNECLACISDDKDIIKDGIEVIRYGDFEPVFEDKGGKIYVKDNAFTVDLKNGDIKE